jgi:glucose-1-phosphatase
MIKTIIFDNGGVLTKDPWIIYLQTLTKGKGSKLYEEAKADLLPIEVEAITGRKSFKNLIRELVSINGDKVAVKKLAEIYPVDPKMSEIVESLALEHEVVLLTNDLGNFDENNKVWKFEDLFGKNIFHSSAMGTRKPDPSAFNFILEKLNLKPSETLFIDDKERNTIVAESLGIKSIIFKDPETLRVELKNLLK